MGFRGTMNTKSHIDDMQQDRLNLAENYGPIGIRAVIAACAIRSPMKDSRETTPVAVPAPHEGILAFKLD
jgi:hypothetical protein